MYIYNQKDLKEKRRELRNNSTPQEIILWKYLKGRNIGYKFTRQFSVGNYITDFCCRTKKIIIELDGKQHSDNISYDKERTLYLESFGYKVLRFWNDETNTNLKGVLQKVKDHLEINPTPPLAPLPITGGEKC